MNSRGSIAGSICFVFYDAIHEIVTLDSTFCILNSFCYAVLDVLKYTLLVQVIFNITEHYWNATLGSCC